MSIPSEIAGLIPKNKEKEMEIEQKIVEMLLNGKELDTKTELEFPLKWSALSIFCRYLKDKCLKYSNAILYEFIQQTLKYLISKGRKGREEYIEALKSIRERHQLENTTPDFTNMKVGK